jgi:hypothetical protein
MTRYHSTPEGNVSFTDEEEIARDAEEKDWADSKVVRDALDQIEHLESQITLRRIREAYKDSTWMDAQEVLIKTQRDKL